MGKGKLRRNPINKVIGGVCSGLADYFNMDVTIMRLLFVIAFIFASFGFWFYIILWIVLPIGQRTIDNGQQSTVDSQSQRTESQEADGVTGNGQSRQLKMKSIITGTVVILIGLLFLVNNFIPITWVWKLWPLILVVIGVVMIVTSSKKN